ncbi:hypothetical protein HPB47_009392 [Ixodes persulcatus]|uniref:Uncharacterized protein n=1 Tax=Ixodes persulcatus TaxID=34615 RepID=A0AC60P203_IXOPE|nr:hypothetical protein HPB47_009392 [Ixodes persulcatus]
MPTVCVVRQCSARAAWLRAIDHDGLDDIARSQGYVCSDHFLTGDYDMSIAVRRSLDLDTKGHVSSNRAHLAAESSPRLRFRCRCRRRMVTGLMLVRGGVSA